MKAFFLFTSILFSAFGFSAPNEFSTYAKALFPLYKDLHENPELSFEEVKTAEKIATALKEAGMAVTTPNTISPPSTEASTTNGCSVTEEIASAIAPISST